MQTPTQTRTSRKAPAKKAAASKRQTSAVKRSNAAASKANGKAPTKAAKPRTRVSKPRARATSKGFRDTAKIVILAKGNPHRSKTSKRGQKWACLRNGLTVKAAVAAMERKKLRTPRGYLAYAKEAGFIRIS